MINLICKLHNITGNKSRNSKRNNNKKQKRVGKKLTLNVNKTKIKEFVETKENDKQFFFWKVHIEKMKNYNYLKQQKQMA